ncbi:MAG: aminotransferase class III-fold pyridoxal phosphate-dependent enzyme, partial [Armatimonadetes bacterium]|nr:aminotransferase class III-fold pyridoxal phosphate-dependent enzyme [Armatimonadota bacterium]
FNNTYTLPFAYCYRCWYNLEYPNCEIYCAKILERYFKTLIPPSEIAAIVFEPIQGEGGYVIPPREFFQILKEIAKKYQILLIADEVQTCFGKSGYWTACEYFGIVPDIITLAKGLGNGAVIGAVVFPGELDFTKQGMHSNTFGGQFISCISSLSTIKILKEQNMLDYVKEIGNYFKEKLLELKEQFKCIGDVRALGVLIGVEFVKDRRTKEPDKKIRDLILKECYQKGLLMIPCGESVIRITPSFIISKAEIDWGISILKEVLEKNYQ